MNAICFVKFPADDHAGRVFEYGYVFALRQLLCDTPLELAKEREETWNTCSALVMELKKTVQFLLQHRRVVANFFRIVRRILRGDP